MISLSRAAYQDEERFPEYVGLFVDGYPASDDPAMCNGAEIYFLDTQTRWKYDEENDAWYEMPQGTSTDRSGGVLVSVVDQNSTMPTVRPDGSPLENEDYVKPKPQAEYPFTINGVTFENRFSKAIWFNNQWVMDVGLIQDTSETPLASPEQEKWEIERTNQKWLNIDIIDQLKNAIIEYTNLNDVPADKRYKRIYRQTTDTADRTEGLYYYNFVTSTWEKFGSGDIEAGNNLPVAKYEGELFILLQTETVGGVDFHKGLYRYNGTKWVRVESTYTNEALLFNSEEEKFEEERENQYELNLDIMYQLKNMIIKYDDLDTVPNDKLYKRIYRQMTDSDARRSGLYWYDFESAEEDKWQPLDGSTILAGTSLPNGKYVGDLYILLEDVSQAGEKVKKGLYRFNGNLWVHVAHTEPWTSEIEVEDAETESISKTATTQKEINEENALIIGQEKEIEVDEEVDLIGAVNWLMKNKIGLKKLTLDNDFNVVDEDGTTLSVDDIKELCASGDYWVYIDYKDTVFLPVMAQNDDEFKFLGDFSVPVDVTDTTSIPVESYAEINIKADNKAYPAEGRNESIYFKVEDIEEWLENRDNYTYPEQFYPTVDAVLNYFQKIKEMIFEIEKGEDVEEEDARIDKLNVTLNDVNDEEIVKGELEINILKFNVYHYDIEQNMDVIIPVEAHATKGEEEPIIETIGVGLTSPNPFRVSFPISGYLELSTDGENYVDASNGLDAEIVAGNYTMYIRGNANKGNLKSRRLTITGSDIAIKGDIRELLYQEDPDSAVIGDKAFEELFYGSNAITDASGLILSENVGFGTYIRLFARCENLKYPPKVVPNASGANTCSGMFYNCSSLLEAPKLPSTTLGVYCYSQMFQYCTSLTKAPELLATSVPNNAYSYMFKGCTSLVEVQDVFPATEYDNGAAYGMFDGCTSLEQIPDMSATQTASVNSFKEMFRDTKARLYSASTEGYTRPWIIHNSTPQTDWNNMMFPDSGEITEPVVDVTYYTND